MVYVTAPPEDAARIAQQLVEDRLCACVNLLPGVTSVYRWQGLVEQGSETLMLIKTAAHRFEALKRKLLELHPYELPEIVAVNICDAHIPYQKWLLQESSLLLPSP